jgi:nucleoside-diphosphate kinase
MERSLVLVKPDGVQRGLIGEVISRLEKRGLRLIAAKFLRVSPDLAEKHYAVHKGKAFYEPLISFITSSPVMAMAWQGPDAIAAIRQSMGKTNAVEASTGSIRADFALQTRFNITHASDSPENGEFEIGLWFAPEELVDWKRCTEDWTYE